MTPREAARKLIEHYVRRGSSLEHLQRSHMGVAGGEFSAAIGGNCHEWCPEFEAFKMDPKALMECYREIYRGGKTSEIVVSRIGKQAICERFKLREIYDEIKYESTRHRQTSLF